MKCTRMCHKVKSKGKGKEKIPVTKCSYVCKSQGDQINTQSTII